MATRAATETNHGSNDRQYYQCAVTEKENQRYDLERGDGRQNFDGYFHANQGFRQYRVSHQKPGRRISCFSKVILSIIIFFLIAVVSVLVWFAVFSPFQPIQAGRFNETLVHTTNGVLDESDEDYADLPVAAAVISGAADNQCIQDSHRCTHSRNSHTRASTEYSSSYSAIHAFQSGCFSWSSSYFSAQNYSPQWIEMKLDQPRRPTVIHFQGSKSYPDNTPTNYDLRAWDESKNKWERIMTGTHPKSAGHEKRSHTMKGRNGEIGFNTLFRLYVHQTVWMEKNAKNGYVQLSNVELCWEPDDSPPDSPLRIFGESEPSSTSNLSTGASSPVGSNSSFAFSASSSSISSSSKATISVPTLPVSNSTAPVAESLSTNTRPIATVSALDPPLKTLAPP